MKRVGIYIIKNIVNNKIYIGSSARCIRERICIHKRRLKNQIHENSYLQNSYNKYGIEAFTFNILELCEKDKCIEREQYYLDLYQSYRRDIGYNININANSTLGMKLSDEHKKKISILKKGVPLSNEHKQKIKQSSQNRSNDYKKKMSLVKKGIPLTKSYIEILQYDLHMNFIQEWSSAKEASQNLNILQTAINNNLKNRAKTCGGFIFKYKHNVINQNSILHNKIKLI